MFYKRKEYFRYTFGEPITAQFRLQRTPASQEMSSAGDCALIDISRKGAKIFTSFEIPQHLSIMLIFSLYKLQFEAQGEIVWKKVFRNGFLYGVHFEENSERERLIVSELKLLGKVDLEKRRSADEDKLE